MKITYGVKKFFFDRPAVMSALEKHERLALAKAGAFVRRRARSSMRYRGRTSRPGETPTAHTGDLRNRILFAFDPSTRSVVIGPVLFKNGEAPRLLEYGGTALRGRTNKKIVTYRPRPYMGPALEAEVLGGKVKDAFAIGMGSSLS